MTEIEEMKQTMVKELCDLLIEQRPDITLEQTLEQVFNSDTYAKVIDDKTGLYLQSPRYVYSFLQNELETGKMA